MPKPINWKLWSKVTVAGLAVAIGGPMFTAWISPSEEEIRERYNPDLKRRSLENREAKQAEFDHFVTKLKEYSKSDKPIWVVAEEAAARDRQDALIQAKMRERQAELRRAEMRIESGLDSGVGDGNKD